MRVKIFILGLFFLILIACEKGIKNPYSPELPVDPVFVGVKEFTFRVSVDFADIPITPPNPDYPYWKVDVRIHMNDWPEPFGAILIEGIGIEDREWSASRFWQFEEKKNQEIGATYHSSPTAHPANVPLEWQESIRWRFQIMDVKLDNPQFKIRIFVGENETADTGWFDGWKAFTPDTEGSKIKTLFTFRIESNY